MPCIICYSASTNNRCSDFHNCKCVENIFCDECYKIFWTQRIRKRCPICLAPPARPQCTVINILILYFASVIEVALLAMCALYKNTIAIVALFMVILATFIACRLLLCCGKYYILMLEIVSLGIYSGLLFVEHGNLYFIMSYITRFLTVVIFVLEFICRQRC